MNHPHRAAQSLVSCFLGALLLTFGACHQTHAQATPPRTAAFTAAQATNGKASYDKSCASCHGPDLSGGDFAGALTGATFRQLWSGKPASLLFDYINTRMPPTSPGSLGPQATAEVIAYMLQRNGIAAGAAELPADDAALASLTLAAAQATPQGRGGGIRLSPLAPPLPPPDKPNPLDKLTPVTDEMLQNPPASDWLTWRRTYDDQGFSPLKDVTRANVGNLRAVWSWSLPNGPNENTPLEHDGVLFVHSYGDHVQAFNAETGDVLWQYARQLPSDSTPSVKRNMAIYRNTLLVPTSDDHMVALDIKTGKVVWDQPVADYHKGWRATGGPIVAKGKVMQGIAGQTPGGGSIVALDTETGEQEWRFYTIAQPGQTGADSWNGEPSEKRSGGSVWTAGSYDPQLNLVFFGTGQTYDTAPLLHPVNTPGVTNDALYTDSTLAINPDTGKLAWYYQHMPDDQWDLDWAFEQQIITLPAAGAPAVGANVAQKMILTAGKMAIFEAMDAATGKYLFSKDLGIQNVVSAIDPKTGAKTINPDVVVGDGKVHMVCPHPGGGRSWIPTSYNASTKIVYAPMVETCTDLMPTAAGERPNLSTGVTWFIRPRPGSDGKFGRLEAFNVETKKVLWTDRQRAPMTTGVLATAGGVVFSGSLDRYIRAYDDTTGELLWETRLNDVPSSCPITYSVGGKQYIAVIVGNGGAQAATFPPLVPELQNPPDRGAAVWVFALPSKVQSHIAGTK